MGKSSPAVLLMSLPLVIGCNGRGSERGEIAFRRVAALSDPSKGRRPEKGEAASRRVAALSDASNEVRAAAAASLRQLLAANPSAKTNDHGQEHWERQAAKVKPGMKHAEVVTLLPPYDKTLSQERLLWSGAGTGDSHIGVWRLDHYWFVTVQYRNPDTVIEQPSLHNIAMHIWVKPPDTFTGAWVTWHVNGQKWREVEYKEGKYRGCLTVYHDNGQKSYEQHYVNGVCSGAHTGWNRSGRKSYEGQYAEGKREGTWTHWYEDGRVRSREQFKNGQSHGVSTSWYASGQKRYEVHYREGKRHGVDSCWDESGRLQWTRHYEDGALVRSE